MDLDITSVSAILAAAGVLVGVIYYILDLRHQNKVRQTDLTMRLYTSWVSEEMIKPWLKVVNLEFTDYDDFKRKYGTFLSENEENAAVLSVLNSFHIMGLLFKKKLVDYDIVRQLPIGEAWDKLKPIVEGVRKQWNNPATYEEFEYLYNEMKKKGEML